MPTVNTGAVFGRKSKFTSWDDVVAAVDGWLELIRDGEFVVYDEPSGGFVQYARIGDQLHGEVAGATSFGGDMDQPGATQQALRELGWVDPLQAPSGATDGVPMWTRPDVSYDDVSGYGVLTARTLQAFGCTEPKAVTVTKGP